MPELPEVETVVKGLRSAGFVGSTIASASVRWPRTIAAPSPRAFARKIRETRVLSVTRRGKFIVVGLNTGLTLLIHLRMTGRLLFSTSDEPADAHDHVVLRLRDGRELRYRDTRKFGRWRLTRNPHSILGDLGPEPLSPAFTARRFAARLGRHPGMLKPLLLNQRFLAGLGNIYVDEALWEARLHPTRSCATLSEPEMQRLYLAIRRVLRRGIRSQGTSLGNASTNFRGVDGSIGRNRDNLRVFRRVGKPCPRCGSVIRRLTIAQRSTHICPECQQERCACAVGSVRP